MGVRRGDRFLVVDGRVLDSQSAAVAVGLTTISDAIASFFRYLPNLVAATLIVMFGVIAGQFAGRAVAQAASESGVDFAPALGRAVSAIIVFVVGLMAIAQLKIDTAVIHTFSTILLTGMALAMALSFGLGTRGITRSIVAGFYLRKTLRIGDTIEVEGERGTLSAITSTQSLIERDGTVVSIANSTLLDTVVRQTAGRDEG